MKNIPVTSVLLPGMLMGIMGLTYVTTIGRKDSNVPIKAIVPVLSGSIMIMNLEGITARRVFRVRTGKGVASKCLECTMVA